MKIIAYLRVSTQKQARSGLGTEAQREAIDTFARERSARVLAVYTETESGKRDDRPELARALHHAKGVGATLLIAKLDRLSRDAHFLTGLMKRGVDFVAADMPGVNNFTVTVLAAVAQQEREAISKRTREALAMAKRRGTRLGNPNGAAALRRAKKGNAASVAAIQARANEHALELRPVVERFTSEGVTSLGAITERLNAGGWLTPRGARWHKSSVRNLLARLG